MSENRFNLRDDDKYKSCYISDIFRMELIDDYLKKVSEDPKFQKSEPNQIKLIDDWDGYDEQVYIQTTEDGFIFWEGWVKGCWDAIKGKKEYIGLSKEEVIDDIFKQRFPRIANEFNMKLGKLITSKKNGKFIMGIEFLK